MHLVEVALGVTARGDVESDSVNTEEGSCQETLSEFIGIVDKARSLSESEPPERMRLAVQLAFERSARRRAASFRAYRLAGMVGLPAALIAFGILWTQGHAERTLSGIQSQIESTSLVSWQETLVVREQGASEELVSQRMFASYPERFLVVFGDDSYANVPVRFSGSGVAYSRPQDSSEGTLIRYFGDAAALHNQRLEDNLRKLIIPEEIMSGRKPIFESVSRGHQEYMRFSEVGQNRTGAVELVRDSRTGLLNSVSFIDINIDDPLSQMIITRSGFEYDGNRPFGQLEQLQSQLPIKQTYYWFDEPRNRVLDESEIRQLILRIGESPSAFSMSRLVETVLPGQWPNSQALADSAPVKLANVISGFETNLLSVSRIAGAPVNGIGQIVIPKDAGTIFVLSGETESGKSVEAFLWKTGDQVQLLAVVPTD